jgi:hypothetical protein
VLRRDAEEEDEAEVDEEGFEEEKASENEEKSKSPLGLPKPEVDFRAVVVLRRVFRSENCWKRSLVETYS